MERAAVVTGAASGIGAATVERLVGDFDRVYAIDLSPAVEERWAAAEAVTAIVADVSRPERVREARDRVAADGVRVDALVNSAGRSGRAMVTEFEDQVLHDVVAVNLFGVAYCMRDFGSLMRDQGAPGSIVNVSSTAGRRVDKTLGLYGAAKIGVLQLGRVAALELGDAGIRVNAVLPGPIDTPLLQVGAARGAELTGITIEEVLARYASSVPLARLGKSEEVAEAIAFLASDRSSFVTGECIAVGGGNHLTGPVVGSA